MIWYSRTSAVTHQPIFAILLLRSRSAVCDEMKIATNGMTITVRTIMTTFAMSTRHDGDPRHNVSSVSAGAPAAGAAGAAKPEGEGRPQCGQAVASGETSRPQSGQVMTGMRGL